MSILGKVSPSVTTDTLVYACPLATKASLNISITNRSTADVDATVSLSKSDDLGVASIVVTDGGSGLTAVPTLTITGTGTGATATVSSVSLTAATIAAGGTGYLVGDVVTIAGGTGTKATLTVTAVDGDGAVTAASVTSGGSYSAVIAGTTTGVTGGTGTGLTFTVSTIRYGISAIDVTAQGNNYKSAPTVTSSAGTGATLTAQMTRAAIEDTDAIEYQVTIPAKGVLERTGVTVGAGDAVFVKSSVADAVNAFVFGVEAIA
jgi:hypothetical protein